MLCAKISKTNATKQFDGYVNKSATQSKIVCDIFSKGDTAFNTGDVLVQDEDAYFYFQDRTGDTFRYVLTKIPISAQCCISYRNQSFVLQDKAVDWFLYEIIKCNTVLQRVRKIHSINMLNTALNLLQVGNKDTITTPFYIALMSLLLIQNTI